MWIHKDLRRIGQTTKIARSTVEQVRAKIAFLREQTKEASSAKSFDFDKRLADIRAKEEAVRKEKVEKKRKEREASRLDLLKGEDASMDEMASVMGFGGFGTTKK